MARGGDRRGVWAARLARWRTSGVSIRQFCLDEGVSEPSFYQWRKRLPLHRDPGRRPATHGGVRPARPTFVPLEVLGGSTSDAACVEIRFPSGITLRVAEGLAESKVASLVRLLRDEVA